MVAGKKRSWLPATADLTTKGKASLFYFLASLAAHILTAHHYVAGETIDMCSGSPKSSHSGRAGADDSSEKGGRGYLLVFKETAARAVREAWG